MAIRIRSLGVSLPSYGTHCLRHACATQLLSQRFTINEIGKHLGQRSAQATQIYAKVDLHRLREVAVIDLEALEAYVRTPHCATTKEWVTERMAALQQVADLKFNGLQ
jgi:hypothetical protein